MQPYNVVDGHWSRTSVSVALSSYVLCTKQDSGRESVPII